MSSLRLLLKCTSNHDDLLTPPHNVVGCENSHFPITTSNISSTIMANQTPKRGAVEERLSQVMAHISTSGTKAVLQKNPDDIVVTTALRTAITKGGKGGFKDTAAVSRLAPSSRIES